MQKQDKEQFSSHCNIIFLVTFTGLVLQSRHREEECITFHAQGQAEWTEMLKAADSDSETPSFLGKP